ncbi:MAG: hypothetical protein LBM12_02435 [Candidatus Nomurabacteria bacterium]|jgi:hypothetical protein|nr:hypothetical protein [Candidatus Nomurabacteria bacterium]
MKKITDLSYEDRLALAELDKLPKLGIFGCIEEPPAKRDSKASQSEMHSSEAAKPSRSGEAYAIKDRLADIVGVALCLLLIAGICFAVYALANRAYNNSFHYDNSSGIDQPLYGFDDNGDGVPAHYHQDSPAYSPEVGGQTVIPEPILAPIFAPSGDYPSNGGDN